VLEHLERLATVSVARGVAFAGLAIVCTMVGFAGHLPALLKAGGIGFLLVTAVLIMKAQSAPRTRYKHTELWIMLEEHERPPVELAQQLIAAARQNALYRFAHVGATVSAGFLGSSALAQLAAVA
jgi:hypothetical protein